MRSARTNGAPGAAWVKRQISCTFRGERDTRGEMGFGQRRDLGVLLRREAPGEGHVEAPGGEHVGVAPVEQHRILLRRETTLAAARELGGVGRDAVQVEIGHAGIGEGVEGRPGRGFAQGEEAAHVGDLERGQRERGDAGGQGLRVFHEGIPAMGEAHRRLERGVEAVAARVGGEVVADRARHGAAACRVATEPGAAGRPERVGFGGRVVDCGAGRHTTRSPAFHTWRTIGRPS